MNIQIPIKMHRSVKTIKVSPELNKRYKDVCKLCLEKHRMLNGNEDINDCAYRAFDNEYCPDIAYAESKRVKEPEISRHFGSYLNKLASNDNSAYQYVLDHAFEFSRAELISIIRAFDFTISPYLQTANTNVPVSVFSAKDITKIYEMVTKFIMNEFKWSHSDNHAGLGSKSMGETLKEIERKHKNKTGV